MKAAQVREKVEGLPGDWQLTVEKERGVSTRWVARRTVPERDEKTGDVSEARQFESAVDAEDLFERIHRRNVALGIERATAQEVALV